MGTSAGLFDEAGSSVAEQDENYQLLSDILQRFEQAKTFGSLIDVPAEKAAPLKTLLDQLVELAESGDTVQKPAAKVLVLYVQQAWVLAQRYDAVVANPPYMGSQYFSTPLKKGISKKYNVKRTDLYAIFIEKNLSQTIKNGYVSMITRQDWMHTKSYESIREFLINATTIESVVQLGKGGFPSLTGEVVQASAFTIRNRYTGDNNSVFIDCRKEVGELKIIPFKETVNRYIHKVGVFSKISRSPTVVRID